MKKIVLFAVLSLFTTVMPVYVAAQSNIKSAFDAIIKSSEMQTDERHTLERDPETGKKIGQSDVYRFTLPADKIKLVKNALEAFKKDDAKAYNISSGTIVKNRPVSLAVGDGSGEGVNIGEPGQNYTYALFLAPKTEDPSGTLRYAYSLSYKKKGDKINGVIAITYATTLKYRQEQANERNKRVFNWYSGNKGFVINGSSSDKSWFSTLMSYFQSMTQANTQTRIALATKAYELIKATGDYPEVTEQDKESARAILKKMLSEGKYNSEPVLNQLLQSCLVNIR